MASRRHVFAIAARRFNERIFGEQTSFLRGLIRIARRCGMDGYVFSPLDIDWERRRVKAYVPTARGWKRVRRHFPGVVYDRLWGLAPLKAEACRAALRRLEAEFGVRVFNPDFGDKLAVYAHLSRDPDLAPHLPETLPASAEAIERLGSAYGTVFIKPARGRQGKGIVRAEQTGSGWKAAKTTESGSVAKGLFADPGGVLRFAAGSDPAGFLVQQGLDLVRPKGRAVDVRAIVQKDGGGRWRVSAVGARVGRPGGFVSNLHAGGTAMTLSGLVRMLPRSRGSGRLAAEIKALALKTAERMSAAYPLLGELGLDFGIDRRGKLWLIEVNRQPGRALFARARIRKSWRTSRLRVVHYARFLASGRAVPTSPGPSSPASPGLAPGGPPGTLPGN